MLTIGQNISQSDTKCHDIISGNTTTYNINFFGENSEKKSNSRGHMLKFLILWTIIIATAILISLLIRTYTMGNTSAGDNIAKLILAFFAILSKIF